MKRYVIPKGKVDALEVGLDGKPIYPKKKQGNHKKGNRGHGKNRRTDR